MKPSCGGRREKKVRASLVVVLMRRAEGTVSSDDERSVTTYNKVKETGGEGASTRVNVRIYNGERQ